MAKSGHSLRAALWFALLLVMIITPGLAFAHEGHGMGAAHVQPAPHLLPLPDQAIALIALALVFARLQTDTGAEPLWTLGMAIVAGVLAGGSLNVSHLEFARAIPLIVIGLLLIDPGQKSQGWPRAIIAVSGIAVGLSYGASLAPGSAHYIHIAFFLSLAIMAAVAAAAMWSRFHQPWFRIALKIAGSWMVAIGTILLGAGFR